jgi:soluble lytic murein transglycosylase
MQLKIETAREVAHALGIPFKNEHDLYNPEINVPLGIAYLTQQISQFKSLKLGLLAYNQGPGVVLTTIKQNRPLSIEYYEKVLKHYFGLRKMRFGR